MTSHLLHVFSTFAPGGPQVRAARLFAAFGARWSHTVCALDGRYEALALIEGGVDVRRLDPPTKRGAARAVLALRRAIARERAELVLTYNWGAIEAVVAARSLGLPVVHHEDGFLPDEAERFKRRRVWARRLVLPGVRRVIVPSHRLEGIALDLWRLDRGRVALIPNGVRPELYAPRDGAPALRARLGIPRDAFVVGSVGHLRREKNPVRLIEALARMTTPAHALFVGDGPERERVEAAARAAGIAARVHLEGHVEDPREHYRAMDAFAIPSDTEQMPVALLEALACALPIASTDVGDVARMVPAAGRDLVVAMDAGALAEALDRLAADPELRRTLGEAGRRRVREEYAFDAMVAAYRAVYAGAMSDRGVRGG